jgi:hypothetical protein
MDDQLLAAKTNDPSLLPTKTHLPARAARAHALKNCLAIVCAVNDLVEPDLGAAAQSRLARSKKALRRMAELIEEDLTRIARTAISSSSPRSSSSRLYACEWRTSRSRDEFGWSS